ncbi:serine dehydratase [Termitidicoccus mucosus]|uniref:L-serine dehydratase n=1 Tax=Termitidicoccus mucosus TaxID=1184151 RepID=A0A178IMV1_9BACT|nr:serine dehydratase [Opitutaceae bacterium TSB47]
MADAALQREAAESGQPASALLARMEDRYRIMRDAIRQGLAINTRSTSGLSGGDAARLQAYSQTAAPLLGPHLARTMAYGFAVLEINAQFGRIVATPTAGSSGIVPACLLMLEETRGLSEQQAARALFTAAGIGLVIGRRAPFSGAQGGCQAEVGSASAMAAAAIVEAEGGTPQQAADAAAFALMNTLGMVCDPIGGYVEIPCVSRNGMFAVHSFLAATMALAGIRGMVPLDDVVTAMRDIGRRMPRALKETSQAGLATTPTGLLHRPQPIRNPAENIK